MESFFSSLSLQGCGCFSSLYDEADEDEYSNTKTNRITEDSEVPLRQQGLNDQITGDILGDFAPPSAMSPEKVDVDDLIQF